MPIKRHWAIGLEANRLAAETPTTGATLRWRITIGLGDIYRFIGKYPEALEILNTALERDSLSAIYQASLHRRIGQTLQLRGETEDACQAFALALSLLQNESGEVADLERARGLHGVAWASFIQGDLEDAKINCLASLHHAKAAEGLSEQATAENLLGGIYHRLGEWEIAMQHTTSAMQVREAMGYTWGVATSLSNLGILSISAGEWEKAKRYFQDSLRQRQEMGDAEGVSIVHNNLGQLALDQGNLDESAHHYTEGLRMAEPLKMLFHSTTARLGLIQVHLHRRELSAAAEMIGQAIPAIESLNSQEMRAEIERFLAELWLHRGELHKAESVAQKSIALAHEMGNPRAESAGWRTASLCYLHQKNVEAAQRAIQYGWTAFATATDELEHGRLFAQAGEVYLADNNIIEARSSLRRARIIFRRLGAKLDLARVDRVLKESGVSCRSYS